MSDLTPDRPKARKALRTDIQEHPDVSCLPPKISLRTRPMKIVVTFQSGKPYRPRIVSELREGTTAQDLFLYIWWWARGDRVQGVAGMITVNDEGANTKRAGKETQLRLRVQRWLKVVAQAGGMNPKKRNRCDEDKDEPDDKNPTKNRGEEDDGDEPEDRRPSKKRRLNEAKADEGETEMEPTAPSTGAASSSVAAMEALENGFPLNLELLPSKVDVFQLIDAMMERLGKAADTPVELWYHVDFARNDEKESEKIVADIRDGLRWLNRDR